MLMYKTYFTKYHSPLTVLQYCDGKCTSITVILRYIHICITKVIFLVVYSHPVFVMKDISYMYHSHMHMHNHWYHLGFITGVETVKADIKILRKLFKALEIATKDDLEKMEVQTEDFVRALYSLPTAKMKLHQSFFIEYAEEFEDSETISQVFLKLDIHKYWDYINIDILANIIAEFSLPRKQKLEDYKTQQLQFMNQTTVQEFCEAEDTCNMQHIVPSKAFIKHISMHNWKPPIYLKKVDEFRKKFAHKYDLRESAVILVSVKGGSVIITMMVPKTVVMMVNSTATEFFKEHGIVHLQLNGTCVYKEANSVSDTCNDIMHTLFPRRLTVYSYSM